MSEKTTQLLHEAEKFVLQIHIRARNNAFAHREAATEARKDNDRWTIWNLIATTSALLFTALALIAATEKWTFFPIAFSVTSIVASFGSLFTQSVLTYRKYDVKETAHHFLQGSFQHISQRAREIERPNFNLDGVGALIDDLERDFSLLKARAVEPEDRHFEAAARVQQKIQVDPAYTGALSFESLKREQHALAERTPPLRGSSPTET